MFEGDFEAAVARVNKKAAVEVGGRLSFPSKMDCPAWGIPARRCRLGAVLAKQEGTICHECYAKKGTFRFPAVNDLLEENYRKLWNPEWAVGIAAQIRWEADVRFRWFFSGDLQGRNHLLNIIQICQATRHILHWLPTREIEVAKSCEDLIPPNLRIRRSANKVDGPPPKGWKYTSTVVTDPEQATCPSSLEGGSCGTHGCTLCWTEPGNVAYLQH